MSKKVKIQITLPHEVVSLMEEDIKESFLTRSAWILKAVLGELEKKKKGKKVIDLKI